jgi:hypothetical protein
MRDLAAANTIRPIVSFEASLSEFIAEADTEREVIF